QIADVLSQAVLLTPLGREVLEQQRHAGQALATCHATEPLDGAAEVASAKRAIRAIEVGLEILLLPQQELVAVVTIEQLVGALARQCHYEAVVACGARQTEQRKDAEAA